MTRASTPECNETAARWLALASVIAAIAAIAAIAVGATTLNGDFLYDDETAILENPVVRGAVPAWEAFIRGFWGGKISEGASAYRPLTVLAYRALWACWPHDPLPFRALTMTAHVLTVCVLAWVMRKAAVPGELGGMALLLFAVHATNAQAVSLNAGAADILSTAFGLLAFGIALGGGWIGPAVSLVVACLFKEGALLFGPPVVLAMAWTPGQSRPLGSWLGKAAPTVLVLALVMAIQALQKRGTPHWSTSLAWSLEGWDRLLVGLAFLGKALGLCFVPVGLAPSHGYPSLDLTLPSLAPEALLGLVGLILLLGGLFVALRRRRVILASLLLVLASVAVLLSSLIVRVGDNVPERLLYPALIASSGLMAGMLMRVRRSRWRHGAFLALVSAMTVLGFQARTPYHDAHALWKHAVEEEPKDIRNQMNYAVSLFQLGDHDGALRHRAIAAYYFNSFPRAVEAEPVHQLMALPKHDAWLEAPRLLWPAHSCEFVFGLLGTLRRTAAELEPKALDGYRQRYPACFAASVPPRDATLPARFSPHGAGPTGTWDVEDSGTSLIELVLRGILG